MNNIENIQLEDILNCKNIFIYLFIFTVYFYSLQNLLTVSVIF